MTALFSNRFCNFYLVKNHKIANNSRTTKATVTICMYMESLDFRNILMYVLVNLETIKHY